MINKRTVFVLGAGASEPYGLPTGSQLTTLVSKTIAYILKDEHEKALLKRIGFKDYKLLEKMGSSLERARGISIDRWLELNPSFRETGKMLIAKEINKLENSKSTIERDWYGDLWTNYLSPQCKKAQDVLNNRAYFITFNYDRSLEHFLYDMACATFQEEKAEDIAKIISRISIIHLHGRVGCLDWQPHHKDEFVKGYEVIHEWEYAAESAKSIKIISDSDDNTDQYILAREQLLKANRIYFLGFGYHDENLSRLKQDPENKIIASHVSGSALYLDRRERGLLELTDNQFGCEITLGMETHDVLAFLKNNVPRG